MKLLIIVRDISNIDGGVRAPRFYDNSGIYGIGSQAMISPLITGQRSGISTR